MDLQTEIAFWFVVSVCLTGPVVTFFRLWNLPTGWCAVWATVLVVALGGRLIGSPATAVVMLCLLRQRWDDLLAWAAGNPAAVAC
jgi:uncharacterized membrane protein HdeD (DUF308 family)